MGPSNQDPTRVIKVRVVDVAPWRKTMAWGYSKFVRAWSPNATGHPLASRMVGLKLTSGRG